MHLLPLFSLGASEAAFRGKKGCPVVESMLSVIRLKMQFPLEILLFPLFHLIFSPKCLFMPLAAVSVREDGEGRLKADLHEVQSGSRT